MNKFLIGITIWFFGFSVFSQIKSNEADTQLFVFPMKGDFIHYSLSHTMSNTKHDLKHYLTFENSDFCKNFMQKKALIEFSNSSNKKQIDCNIPLPIVGQNGTLVLDLPTGVSLLEGNLLFQILTIKKFKINSEVVSATVKLEINGENGYTLIFTNFVIGYSGYQGGAEKIEILNLEDIYNQIKRNQSSEGKMYDKTVKNIMEIDKVINQIDELFHTELDKVIRMDN
jgi:hypothetical protein